MGDKGGVTSCYGSMSTDPGSLLVSFYLQILIYYLKMAPQLYSGCANRGRYDVLTGQHRTVETSVRNRVKHWGGGGLSISNFLEGLSRKHKCQGPLHMGGLTPLTPPPPPSFRPLVETQVANSCSQLGPVETVSRREYTGYNLFSPVMMIT